MRTPVILRRPGRSTRSYSAPTQRTSQLFWLSAEDRAITRGNPQTKATDPLNRALSLAIQVDNQEQKGAILHVLGAAYASLNKPDDALENYNKCWI